MKRNPVFLCVSLVGICLLTASHSWQENSTTTAIVIDGDPSDWGGYAILLEDPQGDFQDGGFDIAAVRAFTNDTYLYVLIETHFPAADFVQLDLDMRSGERKFVISFWPSGQEPFMGEVTTGQWQEVGSVVGSDAAWGEAVEIKIPLSFFEDVLALELMNVRPMTGQCCESDWITIDEIPSVMIPHLEESEPAAEKPQTPQVCADQMPPPIPFGDLEPAPIDLAQAGYAAEWFVKPGDFNMPQEILLTPQGEILVYAVRSHTLSKVDEDGTITLIAKDVWGYLGDVDEEGNIYLHMHPDGRISRVTPSGDVRVIVQSDLLRTDCDSGAGFGPDGNFYIAVSRCSERSDLYQVTPNGEITSLGEVPQLQALHTAADGRFLAAGYSAIYEVSMSDYSLKLLGKLDGAGISPGGLTTDDSGNIYFASGNRSTRGTVYRMDAKGNVSPLADIPMNGLSGIEWLSGTDEIVGGQLRQGGVIAVGQDGSLREIVSGNGIITPMMLAFSPCGDLAVPNDDGGMMVLVNPEGEVSWFMDYLSFIPPDPYVAFSPTGTMYASEAAPGLYPVRVGTRTPSQFALQTLLEANYPSGLAYRASDDTLFVSDTSNGQILAVANDGTYAVVADGLNFPTALAFDLEGSLYAVVASDQLQMPADHPPTFGDKILKIDPDGGRRVFANIRNVRGLAFGPDGYFYATADDVVYRISSDGSITRFAAGFESSVGLAFDVAGYLYVSDQHANGIARIGGFPQGSLSGVVTDDSGNPLEGARVQMISVDPIVVGQVVYTDAEGRFSLPAAPRSYQIIVEADGFAEHSVENIPVTAEQETTVDISMTK